MRLPDLLPLLGVRVVAGPLELRGLTDDLLLGLAALAAAGVHEPDRMPFSVPWTDGEPDEVARRVVQYHWGKRAGFTPEAWSLDLAVLWHGELVGTQAIFTEHFLVTRDGETGSWLGRRFQGRGIGTAMRQAVCALAFDHLGFEEVRSAAFVDNPASLAVSRKVGYRPDGTRRLERRPGELAVNQRLVLTPGELRRGEHALQVEGVDAFRRSIGLA